MNDQLALSAEEMRALGYRAVDLVVDHWTHIADRPVGTKGVPAVLRAALAEQAPEGPTPLDEILGPWITTSGPTCSTSCTRASSHLCRDRRTSSAPQRIFWPPHTTSSMGPGSVDRGRPPWSSRSSIGCVRGVVYPPARAAYS